MDSIKCTQCGVEIEGRGVHYQGNHFCSDECCEEFDIEMVSNSEPQVEDLKLDPDPEDDDLGYRDKDPLEEGDDLLDDDFEIREEDF